MTAPSERETREAIRERAEKDLNDAIKTLEIAKEERDAAQKAVLNGKQLQKTTAKALTTFQNEMKGVTKKKDALHTALTADFEMVKMEGCMTPDGKKALKRILMLGLEHGFDKSLCQSFPAACQKADEARTEFEAVVFADVRAALGKHFETFVLKIQAAEPTANERKAAAAEADAGLQAAKETLAAAEDHFNKSSDAIMSRKGGVRASTTFLKGIWRDMKTSCNTADTSADDLKELNEVIATFQKLKEKEPEPEVVAEPEAVVE